MDIHLITLFPELFQSFMQAGVIGKASQQSKLIFHFYNPRDFTQDKHRTVDDKPYGGGAGMLMLYKPLAEAIRAAQQKAQSPASVIYLSPQGTLFNSQKAQAFSQAESLIFICGRYEGIDQRILDTFVDQSISVGEYVVSGGELPAMIVIDALSRFLPGVLGNPCSLNEESHSQLGRLEYPQYTKPAEIESQAVPSILLSGDHARIKAWRTAQSLALTRRKRPDLIQDFPPTSWEEKCSQSYPADE